IGSPSGRRARARRREGFGVVAGSRRGRRFPRPGAIRQADQPGTTAHATMISDGTGGLPGRCMTLVMVTLTFPVPGLHAGRLRPQKIGCGKGGDARRRKRWRAGAPGLGVCGRSRRTIRSWDSAPRERRWPGSFLDAPDRLESPAYLAILATGQHENTMVKIRLTRGGAKKRPFYHIVV